MNRQIITGVCLAMLTLSIGCHANRLGSCPNGQCGPVSMGGGEDGACSSCTPGQYADPTEPNGANVNYLPNGGRSGPLAALHGRHHRGAQSHTGSEPGPAMGPASPTYGYPYYTTRGPRDFLNPNPPSIGP